MLTRDLFDTHILTEGREDYVAMFKEFFNNPEVDDPSKKWITNQISWAKTTLKKSDRVIWFLRYIKAMWMDALTPEGDPPRGEKWVRTFDPDSLKIPAHYYGYHDFGYPSIKHSFEHFMSLDCPAIKDMVFGKRTVAQVVGDLYRLEAEWVEEHAGRIATNDPSMEDAETLIDFGNGWAWINLGRPSCSVEGKAMGHCGNSPRSYTSDTLLSLRKKIEKGGKTFWEPHLTFILNSSNALTEMKGRGNEKPAPRYHKMIIALLENPIVDEIEGGGYLPENNFSMDDLSPELRAELLTAKPELGNAVEYYRYEKDFSDFVLEQKLKEYIRNQLKTTPDLAVDDGYVHFQLKFFNHVKDILTLSKKSFIPDAAGLVENNSLFASRDETDNYARTLKIHGDDMNKKLDVLRRQARDEAIEWLDEVKKKIIKYCPVAKDTCAAWTTEQSDIGFDGIIFSASIDHFIKILENDEEYHSPDFQILCSITNNKKQNGVNLSLRAQDAAMGTIFRKYEPVMDEMLADYRGNAT